MKTFRLSWTIHIFALLHALTALGCRLTGVDDQILLTVLTMAMALVICLKMGLNPRSLPGPALPLTQRPPEHPCSPLSQFCPSFTYCLAGP